MTNSVGGVEVSRQRVQGLLTNCLAQFGVAAGEEAMWKSLNDQLLLKTRDKNSQVHGYKVHLCSSVHHHYI